MQMIEADLALFCCEIQNELRNQRSARSGWCAFRPIQFTELTGRKAPCPASRPGAAQDEL